jgi:GAF domain-containing protein
VNDRTDELRSAVAAGVLAADEQFARLLRSIVDVARAIFGAKASSIMLFDPDAEELVFAAVSGEGEQDLVGRRFPATTGVAGWVLSSRTPLVLEDVQSDPRHARDFAEETGYVPKGLMAVPLLDEELALGVLQVLDRPQRSRFTLQEMELLGLFAGQAAIALGLLRSAQRARAALEGGGDLAPVAGVASALDALEGRRRESGIALLRDLERVLGQK